jgi:hypothetical protein
LRAKTLITVQKKRLRAAIEGIYDPVMQLEREAGAGYTAASATDVADYVAAMARELAVMARRAGLEALAGSLEQTHRLANLALMKCHEGNAAPDDAA